MYSRAILLERIQLALLRAAAIALALYASVWIWHQVISDQGVVPWTVYVAPSIIVALLAMIVMWNTPARDARSQVLGTWISIIKSVLLVTVIVLETESHGRRRNHPGPGAILPDEERNPNLGEITRPDVHDEPSLLEGRVGRNALGHPPLEGLTAQRLQVRPEDELGIALGVCAAIGLRFNL